MATMPAGALGPLAAAWSAGFFSARSSTVTPGFAAAPPEAAVPAMRAVDANTAGPGSAFGFSWPAVLAASAAAFALQAAGAGAAALASRG